MCIKDYVDTHLSPNFLWFDLFDIEGRVVARWGARGEDRGSPDFADIEKRTEGQLEIYY